MLNIDFLWELVPNGLGYLTSAVLAADVTGNGKWNILFNSTDGRTRCLNTDFPVGDNINSTVLMQWYTPKRMNNVKNDNI